MKIRPKIVTCKIYILKFKLVRVICF